MAKIVSQKTLRQIRRSFPSTITNTNRAIVNGLALRLASVLALVRDTAQKAKRLGLFSPQLSRRLEASVHTAQAKLSEVDRLLATRFSTYTSVFTNRVEHARKKHSSGRLRAWQSLTKIQGFLARQLISSTIEFEDLLL